MATAPKRVIDDRVTTEVVPSAAGDAALSENSLRDARATRGADPDAPAETPPEPFDIRHEHPTLEEVAAEAYAIYMANGRQDGRDLDDWLEAERRMRTRNRA